MDKIWAAIDCGFAINPAGRGGPGTGVVWMGMGQGLCEETVYEKACMWLPTCWTTACPPSLSPRY